MSPTDDKKGRSERIQAEEDAKKVLESSPRIPRSPQKKIEVTIPNAPKKSTAGSMIRSNEERQL
jgi:hypothetical protein